MLLGEDGGGHEHRHLPAVQDGLEGGPHGHLRLAVADVAAHQAVHGPRLLHVLLDLADGQDLVGRLHVGERGLELQLPGGIGREGAAGQHLAGGVESEQLLRQVGHGPPHPLLGARPLLAAQAGESGRVVPGADVAADPVQLVGGYEQLVALGVAQLQVLALAPVEL